MEYVSLSQVNANTAFTRALLEYRLAFLLMKYFWGDFRFPDENGRWFESIYNLMLISHELLAPL